MGDHPSVHHAWDRVRTWLGRFAPATAATLRPPMSVQALARREAAIDLAMPPSTQWRMPAQLRTWFQLHDGWDRHVSAALLPGWTSPMSLQRCERTWQLLQQVWADLATDDPSISDRLGQAVWEPAGTPVGVYLPAFVPIDEDQSGDVLFVDCRPGPLQGCVRHWMKHDGDAYAMGWDSIAAMLTDVADHLEQMSPCRYWRPQVTDGYLGWELDTRLGFQSRCLARGPLQV